jgi:hypothetical protein
MKWFCRLWNARLRRRPGHGWFQVSAGDQPAPRAHRHSPGCVTGTVRKIANSPKLSDDEIKKRSKQRQE